jgi:hypothetical protein
MMGWVWLALGVIYVAVLAARAAPTGWYVGAAIPFFLGALGYFQAREQTCVFLAAVGQRNLDGGAERISDPAELARVRAEAWRVWLRAAAAAALLTFIAFSLAALVN